MPTEPSARDREEARRIAGRCWYATGDSPDATCDAVGEPDHCVQCVETDAIAHALAAREAAVREAACRAVCVFCRVATLPAHVGDDGRWRHSANKWTVVCGADAIRAQGVGA